jgi:antitoxin PrlF
LILLKILNNQKFISSQPPNMSIRNTMSGKNSDTERGSPDEPCGCNPVSVCNVEAVLSVDERGQMVLPKEVREKAGIRPGDKLALISWEKDGEVCCLALMKAGNLSGMVKRVLGPLIDQQE